MINKKEIDLIINKIKNKNHLSIIGIAGGSAVGKSNFFVQELIKEIKKIKKKALTLTIDNFMKGKDFLEKYENAYVFKWDDPRNFSIKEVKKFLSDLKEKLTAYYPQFDYNTLRRSTKKTQIVLDNNYVLIFEGIYALHKTLIKLYDYKIYLNSPLWERFLKRMLRFRYDFNVKNNRKAFKQFFYHVYPAHKKFVVFQEKNADLVKTIPLDPKILDKKYLNLIKKERYTPTKNIIWEKHFPHYFKFIVGKNYNAFYLSIVKNNIIYFKTRLNKKEIEILKTINWNAL